MILVVFAVLLAGMVYVNYRLNSSADDALVETSSTPSGTPVAAENTVTGNYFEVFREERDRTREIEIGYLDEIIAASASDSETLEEAQQQKLALVANMEAELVIEKLLLAKGFKDAAVTFHAGNATVVVNAEEISSEQAAQILDIVTRETDLSAQQVKIVVNKE